MKLRDAKIIGFSLSDGDDQTVIVNAVAKRSGTTNKKFSKVAIRLFENEDLLRLQDIDRKIGLEAKKKKKFITIKESIIKFGRLLMA